jgi:hypothetical protein
MMIGEVHGLCGRQAEVLGGNPYRFSKNRLHSTYLMTFSIHNLGKLDFGVMACQCSVLPTSCCKG